MSNDPNENNKWIYNTDDYTPISSRVGIKNLPT